MLTVLLGLIQGNIGRILLYSVGFSVAAYFWFDYQQAKEDVAVAQVALQQANMETEESNKVIEEVVNEYATLDEQVQKEQKQRRAAQLLASKRQRELRVLLDGMDADAAGGAVVTSKLLDALERIQGSKFDDRATLLQTRPSSDGTFFRISRASIEAMITDLQVIGDYMEQVYTEQ